MRITPLDIYQREFKRVLRGFDPDEVEDFLEQVADDYEQMIKENAELRERISTIETQFATEGQVDGTKMIEDMIRQANERVNNIIQEAENEADNIIQQAREEADRIIEEAKSKAREGDSESASALIQQAKEEANNIIQDAKNTAEDIIRGARTEADNIIRSAESKASEISEPAMHKEESDNLLEEARAKANEIIEKAKIEEMELRQEILRLKGQKERFLSGYRELLYKHLRLLTDESEDL